MTKGLLSALGIILLDQLSKIWLMEIIPIMRPIEITPFLNLVRVWNRGVSFGMFAEIGAWEPWLLIGGAGMILIALLWWLKQADTPKEQLFLGLIIGGATGNIIDRMRFGAVFDFIDVHVAGWHWPAFNVADSAIFIGVALIVLWSFLDKKRA